MSRLALIDYGSGNLHSAERALVRAAASAGRTHEITVTSDPAMIAGADRIVLPGVGHFADCAANLRRHDGLVEALTEAVQTRGIPFLGICVGLQLLATTGLEDGNTPGLDWIAGTVDRIAPSGGLRVPHVGWNELVLTRDHPVLDGLGPEPHAYFTHSYALLPANQSDLAATTEYGGAITACVGRANIFATQFHPEKSQAVGLKLLENFIRWAP